MYKLLKPFTYFVTKRLPVFTRLIQSANLFGCSAFVEHSGNIVHNAKWVEVGRYAVYVIVFLKVLEFA